MKKHFLYLYLIFSIILLTSCPGAISSITWKELGHGYVYYESVGLPTIFNFSTKKGINGVVFSYNHNDKFIIAQAKNDLLPELGRTRLISEDKYYDFLVEKGHSEYWIIAHKNDSIYGPYNKETYILQRKILGVPSVLQLNEY